MRRGIYKDKNGKWFIHTTIKGKSCTIRGYDSKRECDIDYDRAIKEWSKNKGLLNDKSILLQDLCDDYYSYRAVNMSVATLNKDKTQERILISYFGNCLISGVFSVDAVKDFYNKHKDEYRLLNYYKSLMSFAYSRQLIDHNYTSFIALPKTRKSKDTELKLIPPNVKQAFLDTLKDNHEYFIMFYLFAYLGCRLSEFLGICYDCVDLENKTITIKRQLLPNGNLTSVLKTSASYRVIPLNEDICSKLLKKYGKKMPNIGKNIVKSSKVFEQKRLFTISHTTFKRILKHYLPDYSSHCFRHTRATELGNKCENIADVIFCAKWLGHSTSMFLNTYCHLGEKDIAKKFLKE